MIAAVASIVQSVAGTQGAAVANENAVLVAKERARNPVSTGREGPELKISHPLVETNVNPDVLVESRLAALGSRIRTLPTAVAGRTQEVLARLAIGPIVEMADVEIQLRGQGTKSGLGTRGARPEEGLVREV